MRFPADESFLLIFFPLFLLLEVIRKGNSIVTVPWSICIKTWMSREAVKTVALKLFAFMLGLALSSLLYQKNV
jgi:hypothetical protein